MALSVRRNMSSAQNSSSGGQTLVSLQMLDTHVALVRLRRREAHNAVNPALASELEAIVETVERDPSIRVAIITGDGQSFCSGADLKVVAAGGLDDCFTSTGGFGGFVNAVRAKPWIAAVNGPALAGGFEIVLACDLVISAETAKFGLPEVKRGLIASAGGLYRLPRLLPRAVAMELITTGRSISSDRALALGLVNKVVANADLLPEVCALAREICANAPLAVRESVRIVRMASGFDNEELRRESERSQEALQQTADYGEGSRAFIEKREPEWKAR